GVYSPWPADATAGELPHCPFPKPIDPSMVHGDNRANQCNPRLPPPTMKIAEKSSLRVLFWLTADMWERPFRRTDDFFIAGALCPDNKNSRVDDSLVHHGRLVLTREG